ncbi:hypothetical protein BABINDRAFT_35491 [Babjeviella inositovora NRRL Y-12698]|uniref:DNA polymerase epsilon catalytic subunit n=1 Tax=Babjeviella inositovora NRRL Y-12698 TaxID=984486 RepID=A0A1E3QRN8_9ASCO|nr:uncharacterized protein BABINDRAFT_35491 [Babjeviella inositovora NRRL Y-12698]ODQ80376.1 hypothetical protein BABINDRAFT_35491 [Babjeviella inositovora NRRL Y-12698]
MPLFKGSSTARFVKNDAPKYTKPPVTNPMVTEAATRLDLVSRIDRVDSLMGFDRFDSGPVRTGWLINMHATTVPSDKVLAGLSAVDYYFLDVEGGLFKTTLTYDPYFLVACTPGSEADVEEMLKKRLESCVKTVARVAKDDLAMPNHLMGLRSTLLQLLFHNVTDLLEARRLLAPLVAENRAQKATRDVYAAVNAGYADTRDAAACIEDIREYDVPYHVRVAIDKGIRVGKWYDVQAEHGMVALAERTDLMAFADPVVLAFDIETTKAPLKFPEATIDQIMMISYMIDGEGFLITNREIIAEDIADFEYTPRPEYPGTFAIFNEADEKALLVRFFEHIREVMPTVIATFNGDFFDWPFVETRAAIHGLDMFEEIGFAKDSENEYKSKYCVHMDCYRWVKRDSYLPQGSQGLKAVTTAKLGYNPIELDPELMTPYAYEKPQLLSEYSVSDAVATYYLYYKYVHPFIFSLCTIIPLNPDEVLRKGTGTLCEMLLMVQAYEKSILLPNKHSDPLERFYDGHLIESETYVGGHVESLEAGVFRSDISTDFKVVPEAVDEILGDLRAALRFSIEVEEKKKMEDVTNFEEVYEEVRGKLSELRENPHRHENPLIYHVDVASMYPNIMTTNRLQPDSMKLEKDCAACDFNRPGKTCDRRLAWSWRGEFYPAQLNEYGMIKRALQNETFPAKNAWQARRTFEELPYPEQVALIKQRLSDYSRKVYHRVKVTETVQREAIVCQRENPFYVDTVSAFRDRRYEFKGLAKVWKGKAAKVARDDKHGKDEAMKMVVLYDSLQLAHKVILNSFYGYVMRKGSRWYSMEMAGITCLTGATIIQMARQLVERLGRPLELDTDGIWCILPSSFPENVTFTLKSGKTVVVSYPCSMLNYLVHQRFTNHQYQELEDPATRTYKTHSDNSIFFEVDGPYKAMILPTSKEEGKGLKKRYAVFNDDGSIAELKGFEIKRRGELQLIKNFQGDIFKLFLDGDSLESCYASVANVANRWLDVLDTKGAMLEDEDLIELICENRSMSKTLEEYGTQKSTSITTAKRLGEFLGEEMVKDKGLACKYIISSRPANAPVTERAIPVAIFLSELGIKRTYLRRWLKNPGLDEFDPRGIIDWDYYRERLASVVQKIITIPAALQGVTNPVPRVPHPDWLQRKIKRSEDTKKQSSIGAFFEKTTQAEAAAIQDIEDFGSSDLPTPRVGHVTRKRRPAETEPEPELVGPCPDMTIDYPGFLQFQMQKWKSQQAAKERRRRLFGQGGEASHRLTIGNLVRRQAESLTGSVWQVLQYKPDPAVPGDLRVFVLIDGKVQSFTVHVPKTVYVSFRSDVLPDAEIPQCEVEKSEALLPNGHDSSNLFKLTMAETTFRAEALRADGLFQHASVQGLYETRVDAVERAIIELGAAVEFDLSRVGALGRALKHGFDMKTLKAAELDRYLRRFAMDTVYLFHCVSHGYEVFAVFRSWEARAHMFALKPLAAAAPLPAATRLYKEVIAAKKDKLADLLVYPESMEFDMQYFGDTAKLLKKLDGYVGKIHEERSTTALFVVQSPGPARVVAALGALAAFPVVQMVSRDVALPAVGWAPMLLTRVASHYLLLGAWLRHLLALARTGNIPMGNLPPANTGYVLDITYARRLAAAHVVLWWSPTPLADHGGVEMDETAPDLDDLGFPGINNPEIYETACLEISIDNLNVNAILASALLNEAEGADLADQELVFDDNHGASSFADAFSGPALAVLRVMVKGWWDDAVAGRAHADAMMHGFVAWVQSPGSFLYAPALHYHVHNLVRKVLFQLFAEFRKMGAAVVFANRNKIVLATSKVSVENSYAYGQYIVKAARAKPMFNYLDLEIVRYWDLLIWMDEHNFGGRACAEITSDAAQLVPYARWHIKNFLPGVLQPEFDDWVVIFMDALVRAKGVGNLSQSPARATQITQLMKLRHPTEEDADSATSGVCEMFRKPLEKRVVQLIRRQAEAYLDPTLRAEYAFPHLAGSTRAMKNPTLELVKFLAQVFALSQKRNIEVRLLRRDLLKLFEIREFSKEATFADPSASLVMGQVVCAHCSHTRDLDFCRDDERVLWSCDRCDKPYNRIALEERLVADFTKLLSLYFAQDLKCAKCHGVRRREISDYCECSGAWTETMPHDALIARAEVYKNVAVAYNLKLLLGVLDELL